MEKAINGDDFNDINRNGTLHPDSVVHSVGYIPAPDGMPSVPNYQSQLSRSSSMNRLEHANERSVAGSVMGTSACY